MQDADAAVITVLVRPEQTANYESVLARLGTALQASAVPIRKRQAAGMESVQGHAAVERQRALHHVD